MVKIRRLTYRDCGKLKRLISYLSNDENDKLAKSLLSLPVGFVNSVLPLKLKFKPESFILFEDNEIMGLITTAKTAGNPQKINITKLIFKENRYEIGKNLVDYVLHKYGNQGVKSFMVTIDECHDELFNLFIKGCGFRQCASESLWKIEKPIPRKSDIKWRYAQNSDSKEIAELYNSELENIYKISLSRDKKEFESPLFAGFTDYYKIRYVLEEDKKILGYLSITTSDNINYIFDITTHSGFDFDYDEIINFMICQTARYKRAFYPIIKQKNYIKNSENLENYLKSKNYNRIQTQQILVKDYYKPIENYSNSWQVFLLGEYPTNLSS